MKNLVVNSGQSFYIESEEDDEEKQLNKDHNEDGSDSDSDSSNYSNDNQIDRQNNKSPITSWPQSYRESIDLYTIVRSPSLKFLGTPTLRSSFLPSSSQSKQDNEQLHSLSNPLLPTVADQQLPKERRSSRSLLPPIPSRRSYIYRASTPDEVPISRGSSYGQAVLNGVNVLCGVGMLSTPYAVKEGGWVGLSVFVIFGILSYYTGILLRSCLDSQPGLATYPDIGQAAFGAWGRIAVSIILYVELYGSCVEYMILEGDSLSSLFPNAHLSLGGLELNSHYLFAFVSALTVLPTAWLRDLSLLSYISAGGVVASILVAISLLWVGLVDKVGFQPNSNTLNLSTLPVAIGLYGYCYAGHAVLPNIYSSMKKPSQYPAVLLTSFAICTLLCAGVAVLGYMMFGESTASQITLNMPQHLVASKIAVWSTVVNTFTKYGLTMNPVALCLEELIPANHPNSLIYSILIRTALVISTLIVGVSVPFFALVMALIGSLLTMLVTLILPSVFFLRILKGQLNYLKVSLCVLVIIVGAVSSAFGTYSAVTKIIQNLAAF